METTHPPQSSDYPFPVKLSMGQVLRTACQTIMANWVYYVALVLLLLASNLLLLWVASNNGGWLWVILLPLLMLALYTKFAVSVHRGVLLKEVGQWSLLWRWRQGESGFFVMALAIGIAGFLGLIFLSIIYGLVTPEVGFWIAHERLITTALLILIFGGVFAKICLIFPAAAVNKPLSVEEAYDLTEGHFLKIFLLVTLVPLITGTLIEWLFRAESFGMLAFNVLISNWVVVFEIAILSEVFRSFQIAIPSSADADPVVVEGQAADQSTLQSHK